MGITSAVETAQANNIAEQRNQLLEGEINEEEVKEQQNTQLLYGTEKETLKSTGNAVYQTPTSSSATGSTDV